MMDDREKVISDFEHEVNKAHGEDWDFVDLSTEDAKEILALLKEQEPVKPFIRIHDANISNGTEHVCGHCNGSFLHQHVKFCPWCGRAVKWDG